MKTQELTSSKDASTQKSWKKNEKKKKREREREREKEKNEFKMKTKKKEEEERKYRFCLKPSRWFTYQISKTSVVSNGSTESCFSTFAAYRGLLAVRHERLRKDIN